MLRLKVPVNNISVMLGLLNLGISCLENSVAPDQLASEEAN